MRNILQDQTFSAFIKPQWRKIVNFRNVVAHEYFGLDYEEIFSIAKNL